MTTAEAHIETIAQAPAAVATAKAPALVTLALGLALVFSVGFVHNTAVHNGAHDTRHANGFPCH